jgi:hypothetical protein
MTEVEGVEYCRTHGGLIIEGETDDECQYRCTESAAKCLGVALFAAGYHSQGVDTCPKCSGRGRVPSRDWLMGGPTGACLHCGSTGVVNDGTVWA